MNKDIVLNLVAPFLKDESITYNEFDKIFDVLSLREQYSVVDILAESGICLVDVQAWDVDVRLKPPVDGIRDHERFREVLFPAVLPAFLPVIVDALSLLFAEAQALEVLDADGVRIEAERLALAGLRPYSLNGGSVGRRQPLSIACFPH